MDDDVAQTDIGSIFQPSQAPIDKSSEFSRQVVDYFGKYVSGGLSADGLPLRVYGGTYQSGLVQKLPLDRYHQLDKNLYKNFVTGLTQQTFVVTQNKYTAQQDERIIDALSANVSKITERELLSLLRALAFQAGTRLIESNDDKRDIIDDLLESSKDAISHDLIVPFVLPFEDVDVVADKVNKRFLLSLQEDAVSRLYDASRELLRQIYTDYFASETYITKDSLMVTLARAFTPKLVKDSLGRYIDHLRISDAYQHTYELHRTTAIDDDTSLYLYFGELTYGSHSFPLFYTKVASKHTFPSMTFTFENRIFINKQAIEYVMRHFSARANQFIDVAGLKIPDAIYSVTEIDTLQKVVTTICEALMLPEPIILSKVTVQESANHLVKLTTKQYLYVDRISSSEISNEYVTIMGDEMLRKKADSYLNSFIVDKQSRLIEDTNEKWDEKSYFDKLLPTIPLSINDEQKRVLDVLESTTYGHIVVDSAMSTGKKHLVTATVLSALSKGQTVLVVSNNNFSAKEVRRVVGDTLAKTSGKQGHNPVFSVHESDSLDHIDDQVVTDIADSVQLVESKLDELKIAKKRKKQALKDKLTDFTKNAEDINLHEVEQAVFNERRFTGKNWIENEPIDEFSSALQQLHHSIQYVQASEAKYLMPYIEANEKKGIEDFIASFTEYQKASKDVHSRLPDFIVDYRKLSSEQKNTLQESLAYIHSNYRQFIKILKEQSPNNWLTIHNGSTFKDISNQEKMLTEMFDIAYGASEIFNNSDKLMLLKELNSYTNSPVEIIDIFDTYIEQVNALKSRLFGYSGRMLVVENLNKQLLKSLPLFGLSEPEKQSENMQVMSDFLRSILNELNTRGLSERHWRDIINILLTDSSKIEEIEEIISSLNQTSDFTFVQEYKIDQAENLIANIELLKYATELNHLHKEFPKLSKLFGITTISRLLARPQEFKLRIDKLAHDLNELSRLEDARRIIQSFIEDYPDASNRLGLNFIDGSIEIVDESFTDADNEYIREYIAHKKKEKEVSGYFDEIMIDSFSNDSIEYRQILGVELQHDLNKKFLQFTHSHSSVINTIATNLREKRKLTVSETKNIVQLYPCVSSEIRSLGSVFPLQIDMFDLVVIDTADSISIAEVFPAVLRAKRVLVIGDSAQTRTPAIAVHSAADDLHTRQIAITLKEKLKAEPADTKNNVIAKQQKMLHANQSALKFYSAYANYETTLKKQHGAYEEMLAFSNKYFYDDNPITLMSRTAPLSDVFAFTSLKPKSNQLSRFTNNAEVEMIIQHLHKLKEQGFSGTIGIVTPFSEQAVLLQKELDECVITDWFERRELRVMTFDTVRNYSRDYMYYSLVASSIFNEISQKLPQKIRDDSFSGDSRSSRLLTGLSGAKRFMHIVHSIRLDEYGGSLSQSLGFIDDMLKSSSVAKNGGATDVLLATETTLKQAFDKTNFVKKYGKDASFITKYSFVNYIKPLSPNYHKALYKLFFLLTVNDKQIVIEFDDFKDRFLQNSKNDKDFGGIYLTAEDVYGYEILGGYGYRFLRLNKFNIGIDPAHTLDTYLNDLVSDPSWPSDNGFVA
ncbi:MAG: AAA domain-containing protein [Candidatus Saccharimonadales bacterium]